MTTTSQLKYRTYLKARGLKPNTIKNYLCQTDKFLAWLNGKKITPVLLNKYQETLLQTRHNVGSLNLYFIIVNDYLKFLKIKFRFTLLSRQLPAIKILSSKQLNNLWQEISRQVGLIGLRDKALLEILYYSGLKVSAIIKARRQDIDKIKQEIFINGQNIALDPATWQNLEKYLSLRHDASPWLFTNFDRAQKNILNNYLSVRSVERIIDKYAKQLRPPLLITPQILRNTLAHQIKMQGGLSRDIQDSLHLHNPKATQKYWQRL